MNCRNCKHGAPRLVYCLHFRKDVNPAHNCQLFDKSKFIELVDSTPNDYDLAAKIRKLREEIR